MWILIPQQLLTVQDAVPPEVLNSREWTWAQCYY